MTSQAAVGRYLL